MDTVLLMLVSFLGYLVMYHLYGKFVRKKIFAISDKRVCPSVKFEDGQDYVPTKKNVVFGFHFTAIAGTGPIVGPAIGVIWGWLPAILWIFLGSIFVGAIHDFGALIVSIRNDGKSIFDYTSKYLNKRARLLFFLVIFFALWIIIAVFGLVIAIIFTIYPESVIPVWVQIFIALFIWYSSYKKRYNFAMITIVGVVAMYALMFVGLKFPLSMPSVFGVPPAGVWTVILLSYGFIASVMPVTMLLQPRGYINAYQLLFAMGILVVSVLIGGFGGKIELVAPAVQKTPIGAPSMFPFLFVIIACGAVSGFHSLVSSGATAKQIRSESDSLFIGYGGMLMEGCLAILVIIAVGAGIGMSYTTETGQLLTGKAAWSSLYSSWEAVSGLGSKLSAFTDGSANMISLTGIPKKLAVVIIGVFVASFAGTTLDSAIRIQRYILSELFVAINIKGFSNKYIATSFAVGSAFILAFATGADGRGALSLWPLLGTVNQMLACISLLIVTLYLKTKGNLKWIISGVPVIFIGGMSLWAAVLNHFAFMEQDNLLLQVTNAVIVVTVVWLLIEGVNKFFKIERSNITKHND